MRIAVLTYDFPHRKTQSFLTRLWIEAQDVRLVIAAPRVNLGIPKSTTRTSIRREEVVHPAEIAARMGTKYRVYPHNSLEATKIMKEEKIELGIVAGARILGDDIIAASEFGILNFHPGLLPEVRGLDSMLWAIHDSQPLGVTAHLIDKKIDAGRIVSREHIELFSDDTIFDLSQRLTDIQVTMLRGAIDKVSSGEIEAIDTKRLGKYHTKMTPEQESAAIERLPDYLSKAW